MDWSSNLSRDIANWEKGFTKYGFQGFHYGGAISYYSEYENKIPDYPKLIMTGLFGENLRLHDWVENINKKYITIDNIVDNYFIKRSSIRENIYTNFNKYRESLKYNLINYIREYKIPYDDGKVKTDDFGELAYLSQRSGAAGRTNLINEFTHDVLLFSFNDLHEFPFDVPAIYKKESRFHLEVIKALYPELVQLPIFSHLKRYRKTKDNRMVSSKISKFIIYSYIENKFPSLYKTLKKMYRIIIPSEVELIRKKMTKLLYQDLNEFNIIKVEKFDYNIRRLVTYTQKLFAIKYIIEKRRSPNGHK